LNSPIFLVYFVSMSPLSCVIFDLDGTLARTNELIFATFNHVAERYVKKVFTPSEITAMFGPPEEVAIERLVGTERTAEAMADFYDFYEHHHPGMADLYGGIRELLHELKARGMLLAVFTGKGRRTALISLEKMGISQLFDIVVTGSDVANYKPSADGIRKVMKAFGLKGDEVLMVGDSVSDVKAAHEAGIPVAAVLWDSYGRDRVLEMDVDYLFHGVEEFSRWLKDATAR
jgi:pyrophosphatase PpaX